MTHLLGTKKNGVRWGPTDGWHLCVAEEGASDTLRPGDTLVMVRAQVSIWAAASYQRLYSTRMWLCTSYEKQGFPSSNKALHGKEGDSERGWGIGHTYSQRTRQ